LAARLQQVCEFLPDAFEFPEYVSACISYENELIAGKNFEESQWLERHVFTTPDSAKGLIEVHFSDSYIEKSPGEFLLTEDNFLANVASLIIGAASTGKLSKLLYDNTERLKELKGIRRTAEILSKGNPVEESLREICSFLPEAWQYPRHCAARINYDGRVFNSIIFEETPWVQRQVFETPDNRKGSIEIYYLNEFPQEYEGPFLKEERDLIDNLAAFGSFLQRIQKDLRS
jgi:hypothetical protein